MSTRILFADDSVTAQNMGKRILTEAGYEVVAVSNGAAAVKKIAEQKPDIIILDLYMPGYSGLEVCEKIRGSMATLKTPVLLTVGKMEPYRPEDANRVRADGVIVKPFEASDLLAIIKKFEERIVPAPPPLAQQVVVAAAEEELAAGAEFPLETMERPANNPSQATVDVPDHMASSSAFTDLLGVEPAETGPAAAAHPAPSHQSATQIPAAGASTPEYDLPASLRLDEEAPKTEIELPPATEPPQHDVQVFDTRIVQNAQVGVEIDDVAAPPASSRPLQIPVYQESAEVAESEAPELMPTGAPPIGEIEIPRDPYLQETAAETTRNTIATATEPGLVSGLQPVIPDHLSQGHPDAAEMTPIERDFSVVPSGQIAVDVPVQTSQESAASAPPKNEVPFSDADFESRVAAALASYNQTENSHPANSVQPAPPSGPALGHDSELSGQMGASTENFKHLAQPPAAGPQPDAILDPEPEVPTFEYHPPVGGAFRELGSIAPEITPSAVPGNSDVRQEPPPVQASPQEAPSSTNISHHSLESEVETNVGIAAQTLASAVGAQSPASRTSITQAVSRAMERLKPELVDEILRELKNKE